MSLNVRVITPDKVVWDAEAEEIILPSSTGQLGILTDHAPLLTALDIGVMRLKAEGNWSSIVLMASQKLRITKLLFYVTVQKKVVQLTNQLLKLN